MTPPSSLVRLKAALLDLLFPLRCLGCGEEGTLLCPACCASLPRVEVPFCRRCGATLREGLICPACVSYPLTIDGIRSPLLFEGTVRQAIHQLKYRRLKAMAVPLGQLMADFLRSHPMPCNIVMPVPLHPKRLRQRGYNQASLLAHEIGMLTNLPVVEDRLVRQRDTIAQARTATALERRANVRDAFVCPKALESEGVLLIDDVCTTGATLDACALALKNAGSGPVWGLTAAREIFLLNLRRES